jgi:hypothetical protein
MARARRASMLLSGAFEPLSTMRFSGVPFFSSEKHWSRPSLQASRASRTAVEARICMETSRRPSSSIEMRSWSSATILKSMRSRYGMRLPQRSVRQYLLFRTTVIDLPTSQDSTLKAPVPLGRVRSLPDSIQSGSTTKLNWPVDCWRIIGQGFRVFECSTRSPMAS